MPDGERRFWISLRCYGWYQARDNSQAVCSVRPLRLYLVLARRLLFVKVYIVVVEIWLKPVGVFVRREIRIDAEGRGLMVKRDR